MLPEHHVKREHNAPLEYPILQIMNERTEPLGAGTLAEMLRDGGTVVSEAGIGRVLRDLRNRNLLSRIGFQGHAITDAGRERLRDLEVVRLAGKTLRDFLMQNDALRGHNMKDILVARRALEREAAAQAAIHATEGEIAELETIVRAQYEGMEKNEDYADLSTAFHKKILEVARCPLIKTLYEFIGLSVQWQGFFIGTFKMYNQPLNRSHEKILNAIRDRDPERASHLMSLHLGDVISNAEKLFLDNQ